MVTTYATYVKHRSRTLAPRNLMPVAAPRASHTLSASARCSSRALAVIEHGRICTPPANRYLRLACSRLRRTTCARYCPNSFIQQGSALTLPDGVFDTGLVPPRSAVKIPQLIVPPIPPPCPE